MFNMLGAIAQFERELMLERQREGIAKAKAEGKYKGRAPTARAKSPEVQRLRAEGIGPTEIAKRLQISRASVYRALKLRRNGSHSRPPRGIKNLERGFPFLTRSFRAFSSASPAF